MAAKKKEQSRRSTDRPSEQRANPFAEEEKEKAPVVIPESPPSGFGYTGAFLNLSIEQASYLQKCWDDLSDDEKEKVCADCAHLRTA